MATTVVITNTPATTVSLKPANKTVASVSFVPSSNISLGDLNNVDVSGASQNEVLVFDQANNKFVVEQYVIDANTNIANIQGGTF
jgi:hypothetical protein